MLKKAVYSALSFVILFTLVFSSIGTANASSKEDEVVNVDPLQVLTDEKLRNHPNGSEISPRVYGREKRFL